MLKDMSIDQKRLEEKEKENYVIPSSPGEPMSHERLIFVTSNCSVYLMLMSLKYVITDDMKKLCFKDLERLCEPWEIKEAWKDLEEYIMILDTYEKV